MVKKTMILLPLVVAKMKRSLMMKEIMTRKKKKVNSMRKSKVKMLRKFKTNKVKKTSKMSNKCF